MTTRIESNVRRDVWGHPLGVTVTVPDHVAGLPTADIVRYLVKKKHPLVRVIASRIPEVMPTQV